MLKLSFDYPTSVDRNIDEIVRCVSALQMCVKHPAATYTDSELHPLDFACAPFCEACMHACYLTIMQCNLWPIRWHTPILIKVLHRCPL